MRQSMTGPARRVRREGWARLGLGLLGVVLGGLASCGGSGGSNPLDNPPLVSNPAGVSTSKLSFAYFQRCVNPIFLARLQIVQNGVVSTNTCAGSGCHDNASGTGGAFRVVPGAQVVDVTDPANTPDVIRASDIYKNFYSAQGEVVLTTPSLSRLLAKPLLRNVLHGGGLIFDSDQDPNVKLIEYWIGHPVPQGQDEFSAASASLFTPADPKAGTCNTN
jgi:hypothetical protein